MSEYHRHGPGEWVNYHENLLQWSTDIRSYVEGKPNGEDAASWFTASAAAHKHCLRDALAKQCDARVIGGGWSLNDLLRSEGLLVRDMRGEGAFTLDATQMAPGAASPPSHLVLASAGMKIHQLNQILEQQRLSLRTTGAHDGQSIAGAIATGAHGSVPTFGAIQDHVRGLHVIVSGDKAVWIEPESRPALDPAFAASFSDDVIRSDVIFEAAVVHLGGMGLINAVLLEVEDIFLVELIQRKHGINLDWIDDFQAGDFSKIAKRLGFDRDVPPYYFQIIINPFDPYGARALHRLLYKQPCHALPSPEVEKHNRSILGEPMNLMAGAMKLVSKHHDMHPDDKAFSFKEHLIELMMEFSYKQYPKTVRGEEEEDDPTNSFIDKLKQKAFALRDDLTALFDGEDDDDPEPNSTKLMTWGQAMPAHHYMGDLFSVAFAIDRTMLKRVLDVLFAAFQQDDGGDFVVTLRFVPKSAGLLAFTRFEHNVVIDLDGMRTPDSVTAAKRVLAAFDANAIPYCLHWGKLGEITPGHVTANFGDPTQPGTPAHHWVSARNMLLPPEMQARFGNVALRKWGLL
jgi:FAD binding domain